MGPVRGGVYAFGTHVIRAQGLADTCGGLRTTNSISGNDSMQVVHINAPQYPSWPIVLKTHRISPTLYNSIVTA